MCVCSEDHQPLHCLPFSKANGLQHADSCCGLTFKTLSDMVGVGSGPILKQHLSRFAGPRQGLKQVLHLIGGAARRQKWSLRESLEWNDKNRSKRGFLLRPCFWIKKMTQRLNRLLSLLVLFISFCPVCRDKINASGSICFLVIVVDWPADIIQMPPLAWHRGCYRGYDAEDEDMHQWAQYQTSLLGIQGVFLHFLDNLKAFTTCTLWNLIYFHTYHC